MSLQVGPPSSRALAWKFQSARPSSKMHDWRGTRDDVRLEQARWSEGASLVPLCFREEAKSMGITKQAVVCGSRKGSVATVHSVRQAGVGRPRQLGPG